MIYLLNGKKCTFAEMLVAYISESIAKEVHTLGMVIGLVDRHLRGLDLTEVQCQTVKADTLGRIQFAEVDQASGAAAGSDCASRIQRSPGPG